MNAAPRVLSLFSGAGGADMALEAAGFVVEALCEIEPHARAVLREHWPDVPLHGDVATLDGTPYRGQVDVVVGGSPCQDLSVAGKRAGLAEGSGTRSSLFYEQVRIWHETQAPYLIWENVKGAFSSSKGADFAAVLSALVGRDVAVPAGGWTRKSGGVVAGPTAVAAWRLLDLQHFGVPQRRERIVVLAARAGGVDPAEVLAVGEGLRGDSPPRFAAREGAAGDPIPGAGGAGGAVAFAQNQIGEVRVSDTMGTLNTNSNASGRATPKALQFAPPVLTYDARGNGDGQVTHTLTGNGCDASEDGTGRGTPIVVQVKAVNISDGRATLDDVMGTLNTDGASTTAIGAQTRGVVIAFTQNQRDEIRDLGPVYGAPAGEPGMKQQNYVLTYDARGNGDGQVANTLAGDHQNRVTDYTALVVNEAPPRTLAFKIRGGVEVDANGNSAGKGYLGSEELAFTVATSHDQHILQPVADYALASGQANAEITEGISPTLTNLHEAPITFAPGTPRRLMPIECERLMGWPDDWTRWGVNEKGVRYELKDTPRYKLCGNGIGKEWMEWIARRLMTAIGVGDLI